MDMKGQIARADGSILNYVRDHVDPSVVTCTVDGKPFNVAREIERQFEAGLIKKK